MPVGCEWRRLAVLAVLLLAPLALGGCGVVSDKPLFDPAAPAAHPLATGLWAMSGPGCEVQPNPSGALPGCAAPVVITDRQMSWDTGAMLARVTGAPAGGLTSLPLPKATDYVAVDGDPAIIELINGGPNPLPPGRDGKPRAPLKPSYLALRVLDLDRSGRIVRGIVWPVVCQPRESLPPGIERRGAQCVATTPEGVRAEAKTLPPFLSFFLTWVSATIPPPPAAPEPKAP